MTSISCTNITVVSPNITVTIPGSTPAGASVYIQTASGGWQLLGAAPVAFTIAANSPFSLKFSMAGYQDVIISGTAGTSNITIQAPVLPGIPSLTLGPVTVNQQTVFPGTPITVSIPINNAGTGDYPGGTIVGYYLSVNGANAGSIVAPAIPAGRGAVITMAISPNTIGTYGVCIEKA